MNIEDFRKNPIYVSRIREILGDDIFALALSVLKDGNPAIEAPLTADAVVSVRINSQRVGWEGYHNTLLTMASPHKDLPELGEPTFEPEFPQPDQPI